MTPSQVRGRRTVSASFGRTTLSVSGRRFPAKIKFERIVAFLGSSTDENCCASFNPCSSESDGDSMRPSDDDLKDGAVKVTRSITIVKPPGYSTSSPPASPAGSSTPGSPFSGSREPFRFRRRSAMDAYEKAGKVGPKSPSSP